MASPSDTGNQSEPVCNFFRKLSKNKNIRKRTFDEDAEECSKSEFPLISTKEKPPQYDNNLKFSTGHSNLSMSSESTMESSTSIFQFESSNEIQVQDDSRATTTLETETKCSKDAQAERVLKRAKQGMKGKRMGPVGEKLYKGLREYTDFRAGFKREQSVSTEKAGGAHGPLRASAHSAHIRVSTRFDYQPDNCKDYRETGYCGYGDACKFLHDRGDYKLGWQLEE